MRTLSMALLSAAVISACLIQPAAAGSYFSVSIGSPGYSHSYRHHPHTYHPSYHGWHHGHGYGHYKHKHHKHHGYPVVIRSYYAPPPGHYVTYAQPFQPLAAPASYCREYQANARVGGQIQRAYGTACYQPDGSWQIAD